MKSLTKRMSALILSLVMLIAMFIGSGLLIGGIALAEDDNDGAYKYFYNQLIDNSMEQRFYKAFETLANNGEFKKGSFQYDLIANSVVSQEEAESYVNGSKFMAEAYGAGRDAFYMDHPDLFYVDLFSTSISAGKNSDGKYVAFLDTSRALTTYRGNLNSESAIDSAIKSYEAELSKIVDEAKNKASVKEQVEYVNNYIASHVTYGFGTKVEGDRNVDTDKAPFVFTSYGALVNKESVCEGYAKSFKAVMDRLGVPCVCVQGYADGSGDEVYEPHMWNYVRVEGQWYIVDPTYNSSSNKKWLLCGGESMNETHLEDGAVSSSGHKLEYPALKPYDYGNDTDSNGLSIRGEYVGEGNYTQLNLYVSYGDKGALKLEEEGKYLSLRGGKANEQGTITWYDWYNLIVFNQAMKDTYDTATDEYPYLITDTETIIRNMGWEYVQFALMDSAPTLNTSAFGENYKIYYDEATINRATPSAPYHNELVKDNKNPSPVGFGDPSNTGAWPYDRTYDIKIKYTDELELLDKGRPASIDFFTSVSDDIAHQNAKIENFKWEEGSNLISFTFTPSRMFIHSDACYYFTLSNVVGKKSHKVPDPVMYMFKGKSVVCSKVFNDGRLYMNVFGTPQLLDNSDISVTDFKDENGKYYAESQRSQLMLVATKTAETDQMNDMLTDQMGVQNGDVVASSTYEIDLQVCGVVRQVPNGSYMQVSFGFPEGYDANDAGTTFKIYHYKHDSSGKITGVEEIPVIVTQYGLIAQVTSFSPFTIVQIENTSPAVKESAKNIYASVNGGSGGTVTADGKSGIISVDGDSITYKIQPDKGYVIGAVQLNGKLINANEYKKGNLTIKKSDMSDSNMLEVRFVSEDSAKYYKKLGVSLAYGGTVSADEPKSYVGVTVGIIVGIIALGGVGFAIWWFLIKNKKKTAKATAGGNASKTVSASEKRPAAVKQNSASKTQKSDAFVNSAKPVANSGAAKSTKQAATAKPSAKVTAAKSDKSAETAKTSAKSNAVKPATAKSTTKASTTAKSSAKASATKSTAAKTSKPATTAKPTAKTGAAKTSKPVDKKK